MNLWLINALIMIKRYEILAKIIMKSTFFYEISSNDILPGLNKLIFMFYLEMISSEYLIFLNLLLF